MEPAAPNGARLTEHERIPSSDEADRAEVARIVVAHQNELFKYIFRRLQDHHLAWDILQITLQAVWEKRHTRNPQLPPMPWLRRIAFNKISDHVKAQRALKRGGGQDDVTVILLNPNGESQAGPRNAACAAPVLESWQEASLNERDRAVQVAIESLSARDQEIFRQRYCDGIPVAEVAAFLDLTESATTAILHRCRNKLGRKLSALGFSDASSEVNRHLKGEIM